MLRVEVAGLPGGAAGAIAIRGPRGFHTFAKHSTRFQVQPGTYRLTVHPVDLPRAHKGVPADSHAYPVKRSIKVRVRPQGGGVGKVLYGTIRSGSVIVMHSAALGVSGSPRSPTAITLPAHLAKRVRHGSILTAAPTRQLPNGLFHRVKSLRKGRATLEPASIWEAFPSLDLEARVPLTRGVPSGASAGASSGLGDVDLTFAAQLTKQLSVGCGGPPQGWSFKPSGSLRSWVDSDLHREFLALPYGRLTLTVQGSVGFKSTIPTGAHCEVTAGGPPLQAVIPVFGVPVPVIGKADLNVAVQADAPITADAQASITVTSGVELDGRHSSPIVEVQRKGSGSVTATAGSVSIGPEFSAGIGGEGLNAHLAVEPQLIGRATRTSCEIDVGVSAGVGLDLLFLHPSYKPISPSTPVYRCPLPDAVYFEGGPGSGPPPSSLGPYTMTPFGRDPQEIGWVNGVSDPAGTLHFPAPLSHQLVGQGWATWSQGYTKDVYVSEDNTASIDLPAGTKAFYLYAEPNLFQDFNVEATTSDGASSGPISVYGESGAHYFGFYTTGARTLSNVVVTAEDRLAIGEFGIAR